MSISEWLVVGLAVAWSGYTWLEVFRRRREARRAEAWLAWRLEPYREYRAEELDKAA